VRKWWDRDTRERFWLESTDRTDIGADLKAPLANASGRPDWRYGLFQGAAEGDVVFHYDKARAAITSVSMIAGDEQSRPIVWAARGSYARERNAKETEVPGYVIPLSGHRRLAKPLTLTKLRKAKPLIEGIVDRLTRTHGKPLYFPFELSERPLRPMQGYAFKLPADFVALFPELADAVGLGSRLQGTARLVDSTPNEVALRELINGIESNAGRFQIGALQALRRDLHGLRRTGTRRIFGANSIKSTYAFHSGGREELQFNVGIDEFADGSPALRAGVGFSFETSRSLPEIDPLVPKVARFNDYMDEHAEDFSGFAMWSFANDRRSADTRPGPISAGLVRDGVFVFIGTRQRPDATDPVVCLATFDRFLPLYAYVEGGVKAIQAAQRGLRLGGGVASKPTRWAHATYPERQTDVFLRHDELQCRLKERLIDRFGDGMAEMEVPFGDCRVDLVAHAGSELWFYEVKTALTVRGCIREAIGQLLEYSLWPGATAPSKLIVVGESKLDPEALTYLQRLNERFPIPIEYEDIQLD
jgi:hypothetical protein